MNTDVLPALTLLVTSPDLKQEDRHDLDRLLTMCREGFFSDFKCGGPACSYDLEDQGLGSVLISTTPGYRDGTPLPGPDAWFESDTYEAGDGAVEIMWSPERLWKAERIKNAKEEAEWQNMTWYEQMVRICKDYSPDFTHGLFVRIGRRQLFAYRCHLRQRSFFGVQSERGEWFIDLGPVRIVYTPSNWRELQAERRAAELAAA